MFAHLYVCQSETNTIRNRVADLTLPFADLYNASVTHSPPGQAKHVDVRELRTGLR